MLPVQGYARMVDKYRARQPETELRSTFLEQQTITL
jgi:hypothetical protein